MLSAKILTPSPAYWNSKKRSEITGVLVQVEDHGLPKARLTVKVKESDLVQLKDETAATALYRIEKISEVFP